MQVEIEIDNTLQKKNRKLSIDTINIVPREKSEEK